MFQAMSFLDFNLSANAVESWRTDANGLHDWFTDHDSPKDNPTPSPFTQPLFVDSGGFKLMNSRTFGDPPEEGGEANEWEIYTNPESILSLQYDYGSDLIATLDYPIPPDLNDAEKYERIEASIDSAVECLRLLEEEEEYADWDPTVYAAIHGHNYSEVAYYVSKLLERTDYPERIDGFAVGSLVPLRSSNIGTLVDIVQGATDSIPPHRQDDLALHVFGVGGKLGPLIAVLGVDSYDSSTYVQAAQHKKFIHYDTWETVLASEISTDTWKCQCPACEELTDVGIRDMQRVFEADRSYKPVEFERNGEVKKYMKSDFYALIAHHNFHVFQNEVTEVREKIKREELGSLVESKAKQNDDIATGLARAAARWPDLRPLVPEQMDIESNAPESNPQTFQTRFDSEGSHIVPPTDGTSLAHTPADFDLRETTYCLDTDETICLILPCSATKPYSSSRTHKVVKERLVDAGLWNNIHKVSVSGLYGPVPKDFESQDAVLTYDYVLTDADESQVELVKDRLVSYLDDYGDHFDNVIGYATSKTYRTTIDAAFEEAGIGRILPSDPPSRRLTEHFRTEHLDELVSAIERSCEPQEAQK